MSRLSSACQRPQSRGQAREPGEAAQVPAHRPRGAFLPDRLEEGRQLLGQELGRHKGGKVPHAGQLADVSVGGVPGQVLCGLRDKCTMGRLGAPQREKRCGDPRHLVGVVGPPLPDEREGDAAVMLRTRIRSSLGWLHPAGATLRPPRDDPTRFTRYSGRRSNRPRFRMYRPSARPDASPSSHASRKWKPPQMRLSVLVSAAWNQLE